MEMPSLNFGRRLSAIGSLGMFGILCASLAAQQGPSGAGSAQLDTGSATAPSSASRMQLPNSAGQVWREYDLRPYTSNVTTTATPQQAVLDWILRETGTNMWFNEPLGILSADRNTLRVYHTPEIQSVVARVVDQLTASRGQVQVLGIKLVTVGNANWRAGALSAMQSIPVQSEGVQGWVTSKENAAGLYNQLRNRGDFRVQSAGELQLHNGQKMTVSQRTPRDYYAGLQTQYLGNTAQQVQPEVRRIEEGYTLSLDVLSAADGKSLEVVLDCEVDQVEKFRNVRVDVPASGTASNGSVEIQVPQLVSWKLNERFRWSSDQVLILSCGVVATPEPDGNGGMNLGKLINGSRGRADALLFLDFKGPAATGLVPNAAAAQGMQTLQPNSSANSVNGSPTAGLVPVSPRR